MHMIFRQILHPATGCASYVFGCTGKKALAVVDAHIEHLDDYLAVAQAAASPIVAIVETHVQADHFSGSAALAAHAGAPIYVHEAADVAFSHRTLHDGDEVELGNDYLRVLHTPGHSPDSICLLVGDRTRGPDPWFLLTGDTLFVGNAGRPDLTAGEMADAGEGASVNELSEASTNHGEMDMAARQAARSTTACSGWWRCPTTWRSILPTSPAPPAAAR
jgi:hydroxyacylglutathione hydrolase